MLDVRVCDVATREGTLSYHRVGPSQPMIVGPTGAFYSAAAVLANPLSGRFIASLASFAGCALIDRRGLGYSDPWPPGVIPSIERQADDLLAVLDDLGVEQAYLLAVGFDAQPVLWLAAHHGDRVIGVIAMATTPKLVRAADYPSGMDPAVVDRWRRSLAPDGGDPVPLDLFPVVAPTLADDARARSWYEQTGRLSARPAVARAYLDVAATSDVRDYLSQITAPVLVLHNRGDQMINVEAARVLAAAVPHSELHEFDDHDHAIFTGDYEAKVTVIERFVTGGAGRKRRRRVVTGWASLTAAEQRVTDLLIAGCSNPEIAERLGVSRETVKSQVSAAMRKTGARNRAELAARLTTDITNL